MPAISSRANTKTLSNVLNPDNVKDFQATQGNPRNFGEKKDISDTQKKVLNSLVRNTQNSADKRNSEIKDNTSDTGKASGQSRALSEIAYTNYKDPDSYNQRTIDEQKTDSQVKSSTNTTSAYGRVNGENQTNMFMKEKWKLGSAEDTVQQSVNSPQDIMAYRRKMLKEEIGLEYREEKTGNTHFIRAPALEAAALLGYLVRKEGICFGSAKGGLLACIRQGGHEYMERMKFILEIMKDVEQEGHKTKSLYKIIGERCKGGIYGKNAHQILNFFDEIMLSDDLVLDDSRENLGHPGRQSLEFPRSLFDEDEPECRQLYLKDEFIAHFSSDEIKNFLQKLRDENGDKPWGMAISSNNHTTSIGFDGTKWLAVNSDDQIYTGSLDAAINVAVTQGGFIRNRYLQTVLQIFGNRDNLSINQQEKAIISSIKNSEEHALKYDLLLAMQNGLTETAEMLIDKIVDNSPLLSEQQKIIYHPVISQKGWMKKIKAIIHNIKIFFQRLSWLRKEKLLSAEEIKERKQLFVDLLKARKDNFLPLGVAMQNGYTETVEAYIKKIAKIINNQEWLSAEEKKQILIKLLQTDEPKTSHTMEPFLSLSILNGHMETATAYIQAINNILWLSAEEKKQVMLQLLKNDDGYSICAAILGNYPKALEMYMEEAIKLIKSLPLSYEKKVALLLDLLTVKVRKAARRILFENYEVMKVYIDKVVQAITEISPLSSEEKTGLLEKLLMLKLVDHDDAQTALQLFIGSSMGRTAVKEYMKKLISKLENIIPAEKQKQFMKKLLEEKHGSGFTPIERAKINGDEEIIKLFDQALGLTREVTTEQH